jgi:hypothetical protein
LSGLVGSPGKLVGASLRSIWYWRDFFLRRWFGTVVFEQVFRFGATRETQFCSQNSVGCPNFLTFQQRFLEAFGTVIARSPL